ncbi:MAG: SBBP repeat-containing protein [Acidobacteria bacterium]|nr:SBBP repeat-containing protein [Acidobacteriota bacterium]
MPCQVRDRRLRLSIALALSLLMTNTLPALAAQHVARAPAASRPGGARVESARRPVNDPALRARVVEAYGKLPLRFEENVGQADARARFVARGANFTISLTPADVTLSLPSADGKGASALRMRLAGADGRAALVGEGQLPGRVNYFSGEDPEGWHTGVGTYASVRGSEVYKGVDVVYYGNRGGLEYDFRVSPRADYRQIRLRFDGARRVRVDAAGDLVLTTARGGDVRQHKPFIYQETDGAKRKVAGAFVRTGRAEVSFRVGDYDRSLPLVIDPAVSYSTLLGGNDSDSALAVAADPDGSVYVAGNAHSVPFPVTPGAFQTEGSSPITGAAFVAKLNPSGTALVYSTYLGKSSSDAVIGIVPDASGNVVVAGNTNRGSQFPTTTGAYQRFTAGGDEVFVTKLNATGTALIYSTLFGGNSIDNVRSLAVDPQGNAYFAGYTISDNFPTTPGAYRATKPAQEEDSFVASLNPNGSALNYSTLIYVAENYGVAVDAGGNAYVTGYTTSHTYPTTPGAYQGIVGGNGRVAFITKVNPTGTDLVYSTTVGGPTNNGSSSGVQPSAIALDSSNNAYITGMASAATPTTPGALNAGGSMFVLKLNPTGSALVYGARFGGGSVGRGIAVDAVGNAYIAGGTDAGSGFAATADAFQKTSGGNAEGIFAILNSDGSAVTYATFLGGDGNDSANAVALDAAGNVYVVGSAQKNGAKTFPTTPGAFQTAPANNADAFVVKFNGAGGTTPTPTPTPSPTPTATPTPTPTPTGVVQFSAATYDVSEATGSSVTTGTSFGEAGEYEAALAASAGGSALITVTRSDTTQAASVDYATQNGTASDRSDYTASFGTLRFAPGEATKTLIIPVTDDRFAESTETFSVTLSNPVGAALGSPSTATVRVTSDDAADGPSPVKGDSFDADFFVRQHYADFLGREADADGLAFWKNEIAQCETRPEAERRGCREVKRINVSAAFFLSIEFQQTGYLVYLLHQAAFGTGEHLALPRFLSDVGEVRRGVVVGQGDWQAQLEANRQTFARLFVRRPEFAAAFPASMTPAQFVDKLNANTGNSLTQAERDARVAELAADDTAAGRAGVLLKVTDTAAFRSRESNRAFVLMEYFGYLRRAPSESPDADFAGYNFWLSKLNQFNGDFVMAEMVKAFLTSDEYGRRFGL